MIIRSKEVMMKILFDQSGNPINPGEIKNAVDDFGKSYAATVNNIIRSSQRSLTQDIFAENVARLMANFKMTRKGLFNGIKYLNGAVQDPNGQILSCWLLIGSDAINLKNYLLQQNVKNTKRTLAELSANAKDKASADLWIMFKKLLSVCMSDGSYGLVAASKILFSIFPEIALPIDNVQWKSIFKTVDYSDVTALVAHEIITWENQTGHQLDSCDTSGSFTVVAVYNVMAMKARP